jgi:hypothetical protein
LQRFIAFVQVGEPWDFGPSTCRPRSAASPCAASTDPTYTGAAGYQRSFQLTAAELHDRRWTLDLGDVGSAAQVTVNGHAFAPVLWKPYQLDVTDALAIGTNSISVRVTNTLANEKGITKASGLLGPVTLSPAEWVPFSLTKAPLEGVVSLTPPATVNVAPGQTVQIPVTVRRYGGSAGTVQLGATGTSGLAAALSPRTLYVGGNGTAAVTMSVTAPVTAAVPGDGSVTLTLAGARYDIPVRSIWPHASAPPPRPRPTAAIRRPP